MYRKVMLALAMTYLYVLGSALILTGKGMLRKWEREKIQEKAAFSEEISRNIEDTEVQAVRLKNESYQVERERGFCDEPEILEVEDEDILLSEVFLPEEIRVLERIVEAEAGGEDADGKLLVANVVLNRVCDEAFPNTISEVVFQRDGGVTQFSPVANGRYDAVVVSQDTKDAVARALNGEDLSEGALYFAARKYADEKAMRWFDEKLTLLFQHGGHEFFK